MDLANLYIDHLGETQIRSVLGDIKTLKGRLKERLGLFTRDQYLRKWIVEEDFPEEISSYFIKYANVDNFRVEYYDYINKHAICINTMISKWLENKQLLLNSIDGDSWWEKDGRSVGDLESIIPNYTLDQIKEKFNSINKTRYNEEFIEMLTCYLHIYLDTRGLLFEFKFGDEVFVKKIVE